MASRRRKNDRPIYIVFESWSPGDLFWQPVADAGPFNTSPDSDRPRGIYFRVDDAMEFARQYLVSLDKQGIPRDVEVREFWIGEGMKDSTPVAGGHTEYGYSRKKSRKKSR